MNLKQLAQEQQNYCVAMRREFHQWPELSGEEIRTSTRICEELSKMSIPYDRVGGNDIVGYLDSGRPGGKLAIRADFDALPLQEKNQVEYRSKVEGKMHACGHDAHTAILLGTARALLRCKDELRGIVYFCFQMGEERSIGATEIIDYLKNEGGVDHVIALHTQPTFETGEIGIYDREVCAGAMGWELTIHGLGGHGSRPDCAIDPIKPLCEILLRFTSLAVNRIDPFSPLVVSPCLVKAGATRNIIPETASAKGSVRFYSKKAVLQVREMMDTIAKDVAHSYGASAEFVVGRVGLPVINDQATAVIGREAAVQAGMQLVYQNPSMGSDNFSYYLDTFPGFYAYLGVGNTAKKITASLHNPNFDIDENSLCLGVEFFLRCAQKLL